MRLLRLRNDGLLLANRHNLPLKFDQLELTFHAIPFMHVPQESNKVNKVIEVDDEHAENIYDNNISTNNNNDDGDIDCSSYYDSSPIDAGDVKKQESSTNLVEGSSESSHKVHNNQVNRQIETCIL